MISSATLCLCMSGAVSAATRFPVAMFHRYAVRLVSQVARVLPSGEKATPQTAVEASPSVSVVSSFPVAMFQRYAWPLPSLVARVLPSGEKATEMKPTPLGSVSAAMRVLVAVFHRYAALLPLLVRVLPSGEKATELSGEYAT